MYELLWFAGGALTYQILARMLRIAQLYLFFQEIHVHALLMIEAVSEDLETAKEIKHELAKECGLQEKEVELVNLADEEAIKLWQQSVVVKVQRCTPNVFKPAIKYDTWNGLKKYLKEIKKR